jgi:hypothetical protein
MSKKTKNNLLAAIGAVFVIVFAVFGPRISVTFGTNPVEAQVPPGCVRIARCGWTGTKTNTLNIRDAGLRSVSKCIRMTCTRDVVTLVEYVTKGSGAPCGD